MLRFILPAALWLLVSGQTLASTPSALAVANDLYLLIAETSMVSADQEPDLHAARAKEVLRRLEDSMPPAIAAIAGQDSERAAELKSQWNDLRSAYAGTPFMAAFREQTYDINLSGRYTTGASVLLAALDPVATTETARSPVQALKWRALKTIVSYLQITTGIVGGTAFSANDQDNDLPAGVAAVDKGLDELKRKYAGKPQATTLQGAISRWQFIKPTLLKSSGQSTPYIVYMHGLKVVQSLDQLEVATSP